MCVHTYRCDLYICVCVCVSYSITFLLKQVICGIDAIRVRILLSVCIVTNVTVSNDIVNLKFNILLRKNDESQSGT